MRLLSTHTSTAQRQSTKSQSQCITSLSTRSTQRQLVLTTSHLKDISLRIATILVLTLNLSSATLSTIMLSSSQHQRHNQYMTDHVKFSAKVKTHML